MFFLWGKGWIIKYFKIYLMLQGTTIFWKHLLLQKKFFWGVAKYSLMEVRQCFGGTYCLYFQGRRVSQASKEKAACFVLVACLAYFSTLKVEAARHSVTSMDLYRTIRRHILEDSALHSAVWEPYIQYNCLAIIIIVIHIEGNWHQHRSS
jgi:hypothetical protein